MIRDDFDLPAGEVRTLAAAVLDGPVRICLARGGVKRFDTQKHVRRSIHLNLKQSKLLENFAISMECHTTNDSTYKKTFKLTKKSTQLT